MAKIRCTCGEFIRDDDPQQSMLMLARADFEVNSDPVLLFGKATLALRCPVCGRIWVFWDDSPVATEYVPADAPSRDVAE
ncbi:hypothetical protein [Yinghuangia soli]|uniref:Uncharacterized protein n=1 Tax=Yinghuangia soli TaxID=2908204 RepID=A0AA41U4Q7_9ACTN|nr:hypothetical protein [Yinghuangia soli]MCF2533206.1 hypothetical protein [Yinghuangia soli]